MRQALSKGVLSAAAASSILSLSGSSALAADASGQAHGSPGILSGNSVSAPIEVPVNACGNTVDAAAAANPAFGNNCGTKAPAQDAAARSGHRDEHRSEYRSEHRPAPSSAARTARPAPAPAAHRPAPAAAERPAPAAAHHAAPAAAERPAPAAAHHSVPAAAERSTPRATTHHRHESPEPGASAHSEVSGSPGVLSGNSAQAPVDVPVNACGNTVDAAAALNPAFGNNCGTKPQAPVDEPPVEEPPAPRPPKARPPEQPSKPPAPHRPEEHVPAPRPAEPPVRVSTETPPRPPAAVAPAGEQLAATGTEADLVAAAATSAGLLAGGMVLYRRGRAASGR
ncbi:chaplin [Streptomyces sp. NPDC059063]|uniref:chaplin n=1 Tax=unclassified Streptomyces TaxID=2593676 RepID=UPI0036CA77F5